MAPNSRRAWAPSFTTRSRSSNRCHRSRTPRIRYASSGVRCVARDDPNNRGGPSATRRVLAARGRGALEIAATPVRPSAAVRAERRRVIADGRSGAPVTLADKIAINAALLGSGASIRETQYRAAPSLGDKGRRTVAGLRRRARAEPHPLRRGEHDLATIGSGPTAPDPSTFRRGYRRAQTPRAVGPRAGDDPRSARAWCGRRDCGDGQARRSAARARRQFVIGDNRLAIDAAAGAAAAAGYTVDRWRDCMARPTTWAVR